MSGGSEVEGVQVWVTSLVSPGRRATCCVPICANLKGPRVVLTPKSTHADPGLPPKFSTLAEIVFGMPVEGVDESDTSMAFSHGSDGGCSAQGWPGVEGGPAQAGKP